MNTEAGDTNYTVQQNLLHSTVCDADLKCMHTYHWHTHTWIDPNSQRAEQEEVGEKLKEKKEK